jgi:hypothetical protein
LREWSADAQEAFLIEALGMVFRVFGLSPLSRADAAKFVASNDPERSRQSPWA